jgi:hypothetical protein
MFAKFETDPGGEEVMINVEKIGKFQEFGRYTSLFLDGGSSIDVKGRLLDINRKIVAAGAAQLRDHGSSSARAALDLAASRFRRRRNRRQDEGAEGCGLAKVCL